MGFDYVLTYKKGTENKVADALSRQFEEEANIAALSAVQTSWVSEIQASWESDELVQQLIAKIVAAPVNMVDYTNVHGVL